MKRSEQKELTRQRIVEAARRSFGTQGYAATSMPALAELCQVAIGGLYHHFPDKRALFLAVVEELRAEAAGQSARAARRRVDPWAALEAGCLAFLDYCSEPSVARILADCGGVLGEDQVHLADAAGRIAVGLRHALGGARVRRERLEMLAAQLYGAMLGANACIARAASVDAARREARRSFRALLEGLRRELSSRRAG